MLASLKARKKISANDEIEFLENQVSGLHNISKGLHPEGIRQLPPLQQDILAELNHLRSVNS